MTKEILSSEVKQKGSISLINSEFEWLVQLSENVEMAEENGNLLALDSAKHSFLKQRVKVLLLQNPRPEELKYVDRRKR